MKVKGWPVMKKQCASCPFNVNGDAILRNKVLDRTLFKASQICHHPATHGKKQTHLCRGARDVQLTILYQMGWIKEPTDEAFAEASRKAGVV